MNKVRFVVLAQDELDNTFEAYEYQEKSGHAFIEDIKDTLEYIKNYPDAWCRSSKHTRRCILKHFPYGVIYQVCDDDILVLAIVNLRKKPTLWASKSVSEYSTRRIAILPETIYTR